MKRLPETQKMISLDDLVLIELATKVKETNERLSLSLMRVAQSIRTQVSQFHQMQSQVGSSKQPQLTSFVDRMLHQIKNHNLRLLKIAFGTEKVSVTHFFDAVAKALDPAVELYATKIVSKKSNVKKKKEPKDLWKSHKIFYEQLLLDDINKKTHGAFDTVCEKIAELMAYELADSCPTSVSFCYSWPNNQNQYYSEEQHLQKVLIVLKRHIEACGVPSVILDLKSNENGNDLWQLAKEIACADRIIQVGTRSMRKGVHQTFSPKSREYTLIVERFNKVRTHKKEDPWDEPEFISEKNFLIPLLYSGSFEKSFPYNDPMYKATVKPMFGSRGGYYQELKLWLYDIFRFQSGGAEIQALERIWAEFELAVEQATDVSETQRLQLLKGLSEADVKGLMTPAPSSSLLQHNPSPSDHQLVPLATKLREAPVIIFCDPGVDDTVMLAQALAPGKFNNILGIVACAGNVHLSESTQNILGMLKLTNRHIPVYVGSEVPLTPDHTFPTEPSMHGHKGLGPSEKVDLPISDQQALPYSDIEEVLVAQIRNSVTPVTIISTAGLTDLCRVLTSLDNSNHLDKVGGISMMGGVFDLAQANAPKIDNSQRFGEFNFCCDPAATKGVFQICKIHQIPIVLASLEITHGYARYSQSQTNELRSLGHAIPAKIADMLDDVPEPAKKRFGYYNPQQCVYDLFATMVLFDPENFTYTGVNVSCRAEGVLQQGRVEIDHNDTSSGNVMVLSTVLDEQRFYQCYLDTLSSYPPQKLVSPRTSGFFKSSPVLETKVTSIQVGIYQQLSDQVQALLLETKNLTSQLDHIDCGIGANILQIYGYLEKVQAVLLQKQVRSLERAIRQYRRFVRDLEFNSCENDRMRQGYLCQQVNGFMAELEQAIPKLRVNEVELVEGRSKIESMAMMSEYLCEATRIGRLQQVLAQAAALVDDEIEVYIIRPNKLEVSNAENWVDPFIDRVLSLLSYANIKVIRKETHARAGDSKFAYLNLTKEADFVLIFQTPRLKQQLESQKWDITGAQFVHAINKRAEDLKQDLHRVIPIRLCGMEHEQPIFGAAINHRDWPDLGFINGLKVLLGDILFEGRPTAEYLQIWTDLERVSLPIKPNQHDPSEELKDARDKQFN